jgi:hypothetical protein
MSFAHTHMLVLCWTLLTLTPARLINPTHEIFFPTKEALNPMLAYVVFAPAIVKILTAASPPTIAAFKRLPMVKRGVWGVYLIVMEKQKCRPKIYIGSGTSKSHGVEVRCREYRKHPSKMARTVSRRIKKALADGYHVTHIGLLCQTPIPSLFNHYRLRSLFIILETAFAFSLWAMRSHTKAYYVPTIRPWAIEALDYDGCCGHSPLWEEVVDENLGLTPEQIAIKEAEAAIRSRQSARHAERKYHARLRKEDPVAYLDARRAKNRRNTANAKAKGTFRCLTCEKNFQSIGALNIHYTRAEHIAKATGVPKALVVAAILAAKTHCCHTCDKAFSTPESLTRHNKQLHPVEAAEVSS